MRATLFAVVLLLSQSTPAAAEDCQLVKMATLPLEDDLTYGPIVTVSINDTPLKFLVMNNGYNSGIAERRVTELGLRKKKITGVEVYGLGGQITHYVRAESMTFGGLRASNAELLHISHHLPSGVDGMLGADYLMNFDLDFDFAARRLNLFSPDHCQGQVVYWTTAYVEMPFRLLNSTTIVAEAILDGRKIDATLSTSATDTSLGERQARLFLDASGGSPQPQRVIDPEHEGVMFYRFQSLSFAGATASEHLSIKNPLIVIIPAPDAISEAFDKKHRAENSRLEPQDRFDLKRVHLSVGMNVLSRLHLYIAYKEKKIYLSDADAKLPGLSE